MPSFVNNGIFIAILAHGLIGLSLIWDKILLERPETRNVVNYIFWLGAMSILGVCLVPFGFTMPARGVFAIAFGAGLVQLAANYFYYDALDAGEASQTLAIMGGFSPLFTYLIGVALLKKPLGGASMVGFGIMVAGGFFMFLSEALNVKRVLPLTIAASGMFGLSSVMQKLAFDRTNFVSAYVVFTIGTFAGALILLIRPSWRDQILHTSEEASPRSKELYFVNRFISGVGSFLIFFAISRASPAIVDAISGVRYVLVFVGVYFVGKYHPRWLKEEYRGWPLEAKIIATALVVAGLVLVGLSGQGGAQGPS
ncbi:MAG: EamA family transporter [Bryobacteraceae bacterium]